LKTFVVNDRDQTRVPFLRGILTRSLLDAGQEFEVAFELATTVRNNLAETAEISSEKLRELVLEKLAEIGDEAVLEQYRTPVTGPTRILVYSLTGHTSAFSRGRHERYLQSSGIRTSVAEEITSKIFDQLLANGTENISTSQLGYLTYLCLQQEVGKKVAKRYLVWSEFQRRDKPLLLMIGGAVGTGKSSIATEIAHRLEIVRTQSTDMLREVMRMMIPRRLLPVLHTSSFEAWKTLPIRDKKDRDRDLLVAEGFRSQAELLSVPCEAVLQRAERESASVILEGVHVLPELVERTGDSSDAIAVQVTLAVLRSGELKSRLRGRSTTEPKRRAKRYLKNFDSIWRLQSFLLSEADRYDAPIITNDEREKAINQVIITVNDELSNYFKGSPSDVFGRVVDELGDRPDTESWQQLTPSLIKG
jgi:2-phosphoglycerate kinase